MKSTDGVAESFEIVPEPGRRPSTRPSSARRQPNRRERRFSLLGQNSCDTYIYIYIVDHNRKSGLTASVGLASARPNYLANAR